VFNLNRGIKTYLFGVFLFLMSVEARLRFTDGIHKGGAEFAITPSDLAIGGILFIALLEFFMGKRKLVRLKGIDILILTMLATLSLSLVNSTYPQFTLLELLRIFKLWIIFVFVRNSIKKWDDLRFIIFVLSLTVLIHSFYGWLQFYFGSSLGLNPLEYGRTVSREVGKLNIDGMVRVTGLMGHPNLLAQFILVGYFLFVSMLLVRQPNNWKIYYFFMCSITLGLLIITFSRSGWGAFVIGTMAFTLTYALFVVKKMNLYRYTKIGFTLAGIFLLLYFVSSNLILERFANARESSILDRIDLLTVALNMTKSHPFLGVGLNNFTEVMTVYDTVGISRHFPAPVHNIYILTLSETGLFGFMLYISFCFALISRLLRNCNRRYSIDIRIVSIGVGSALVVLLASGMLSWGLRGDSLMTTFWVLGAIAYALPKLSTEKGKTVPTLSKIFTQDRFKGGSNGKLS